MSAGLGFDDAPDKLEAQPASENRRDFCSIIVGFSSVDYIERIFYNYRVQALQDIAEADLHYKGPVSRIVALETLLYFNFNGHLPGSLSDNCPEP